MNKVILTGRAVRDPEVRYTQEGKAIARFTIAVDRMKEGADFPSCNAWDKQAEFVEKYIKKGIKILVEGRIQTGSYTNKDNQKVYTTDINVDRIEFLEKKGETSEGKADEFAAPSDDFMSIPDGLDEEMPFN